MKKRTDCLGLSRPQREARQKEKELGKEETRLEGGEPFPERFQNREKDKRM